MFLIDPLMFSAENISLDLSCLVREITGSKVGLMFHKNKQIFCCLDTMTVVVFGSGVTFDMAEQ